MKIEKIFSKTPVNSSFEEIEAGRYAKLKSSPKEMFNPSQKEASPLEGYERTKKSLGL